MSVRFYTGRARSWLRCRWDSLTGVELRCEGCRKVLTRTDSLGDEVVYRPRWYDVDGCPLCAYCHLVEVG